MKFILRSLGLLLLLASLGNGDAFSEDRISLIDPAAADQVWSFNNGQEFPGATGSLSVDSEMKWKDQVSLKLVGDFSGGGGYVQAGRRLDDLDISELSFWVRANQTDKFTLRLGDASGQTHQIVLKLEEGEDWQRVVLPIEEFFKNRGKANALTNIAKYESWGGAKDGNWHGPARGLYLLLSKQGENAVRTLWLSDIAVALKPTPVAGAEVKSEIPLAEISEGIHDWRYSNGAEFKGAKGALTVEGDDLKLAGDFTGGGAYVAAIRDLDSLGAPEVSAIRMRLKSGNAKSLSVQLVDGTGQTHQRKGLKVTADGEWHDFALIPKEIAGGEHWGGANDGVWHDPPRRLVLSLTTRSDAANQPEILLSDVRAEAVFPVFAEPAAFKIQEALVLSRTLEEVNQPASIGSSSFEASPGQWEVSLTYRSDLHSPDNSYNGVLRLNAMNAAGDVIESVVVSDVFGKHETTTDSKVVQLPAGTASAKFEAKLNKTYGEFRIENLSAAYLAPAPRKDDSIERLLFSTAQLGNLLFPDSSRKVGVTVEARKPLADSRKTLSYVVRDYWGAEQMQRGRIELGAPEKKADRFVYEASVDLSDVDLVEGRYYELHAEVGGDGDSAVTLDPFRNHTSFAILPDAITRQYEPEEVPFTARNWDNRIGEYIRLTDRLGVRICGLWGGWSSKPPYKPQAPGLELCRELGMGWLTTTPIKHIERGKDDEWSETALRQGVRNFLKAYGDERPLIINLGNEPHGTGARVEKNVAAYRAVYEEVKKVDSTIPVVATSVEPNEEYFKNGYGKWCDAFDFHIYEQPENVRRNMEKYQALMEKYDVVKPLWSTELGLNSQGQPRHEVAVQVFKKFSTFFAAGGENVSWFGLLYPDPDGTQHGSSGDSHNVFDCRFNRYCPRLDAVALYHAVNSIAIKEFVEEKRYPNGVHAFLFRDRNGDSLQVLWNEKGNADLGVPLPGADEVLLRYIDGTGSKVHPAQGAITVSVTEDPLLLLYKGEAPLPGDFTAPAVSFGNVPDVISTGEETAIGIQRNDIPVEQVELKVPPFWKARHSTEGDAVLTPLKGTGVREVEVRAAIHDAAGKAIGEIYRRMPRGK